MCNGSTQFRVNAGWDAQGFTTLVVSDYINNLWAFFGVSDVQFEAGVVNPNPMGQSANIGTFPTARMAQVKNQDPELVVSL